MNRQTESVPVIVSLTSIPSRLDTLHITIRSLMGQFARPEKIILWLNDALLEHVPKRLADLECELFEIRFSDQTCSHRKLVHALAAFPDKIIVTCDDDLIYGSDWLQRLYQSHQFHPHSIIGHECRKISRGSDGMLRPYRRWPYENKRGGSCAELMPIGFAGVLYPPESLSEQVLNAELYMQLSPKADDLWFKAMSYLKGTNVVRSYEPGAKPVPVIGSQLESLGRSNVKQGGNERQWQALSEYFQIEF